MSETQLYTTRVYLPLVGGSDVVDELIARREAVAFDPTWVARFPIVPGVECLMLRHTLNEGIVTTLSPKATLFLQNYCLNTYQLPPTTINDHWEKARILEMLDGAIRAAKEEGT